MNAGDDDDIRYKQPVEKCSEWMDCWPMVLGMGHSINKTSPNAIRTLRMYVWWCILNDWLSVFYKFSSRKVGNYRLIISGVAVGCYTLL